MYYIAFIFVVHINKTSESHVPFPERQSTNKSTGNGFGDISVLFKSLPSDNPFLILRFYSACSEEGFRTERKYWQKIQYNIKKKVSEWNPLCNIFIRELIANPVRKSTYCQLRVEVQQKKLR